MACHTDINQGNNLQSEWEVSGGRECLICQNFQGSMVYSWEKTFDKLQEL